MGRVVCAVVLAALVGCGSGVYPVKGKVYFDGKPMAGGGAISFVPLGPQAGKAAGGEIAPDGSFELTTNKPGDGSMAGEFRVVVTQVTVTEPERTEDGARPASPTAVVPVADRIPAVYGDAYASPLRAVVQATGPNEIDVKMDRTPAK